MIYFRHYFISLCAFISRQRHCPLFAVTPLHFHIILLRHFAELCWAFSSLLFDYWYADITPPLFAIAHSMPWRRLCHSLRHCHLMAAMLACCCRAIAFAIIFARCYALIFAFGFQLLLWCRYAYFRHYLPLFILLPLAFDISLLLPFIELSLPHYAINFHFIDAIFDFAIIRFSPFRRCHWCHHFAHDDFNIYFTFAIIFSRWLPPIRMSFQLRQPLRQLMLAIFASWTPFRLFSIRHWLFSFIIWIAFFAITFHFGWYFDCFSFAIIFAFHYFLSLFIFSLLFSFSHFIFDYFFIADIFIIYARYCFFFHFQLRYFHFFRLSCRHFRLHYLSLSTFADTLSCHLFHYCLRLLLSVWFIIIFIRHHLFLSLIFSLASLIIS